MKEFIFRESHNYDGVLQSVSKQLYEMQRLLESIEEVTPRQELIDKIRDFHYEASGLQYEIDRSRCHDLGEYLVRAAIKLEDTHEKYSNVRTIVELYTEAGLNSAYLALGKAWQDTHDPESLVDKVDSSWGAGDVGVFAVRVLAHHYHEVKPRD